MKNTVMTSFVFLKQKKTSPPLKQKQRKLTLYAFERKNLYTTTNYTELKPFVCLQLLVKLVQSDLEEVSKSQIRIQFPVT